MLPVLFESEMAVALQSFLMPSAHFAGSFAGLNFGVPKVMSLGIMFKSMFVSILLLVMPDVLFSPTGEGMRKNSTKMMHAAAISFIDAIGIFSVMVFSFEIFLPFSSDSGATAIVFISLSAWLMLSLCLPCWVRRFCAVNLRRVAVGESGSSKRRR